MSIEQFAESYTRNEEILSRGYVAIGLILAIFDDDKNAFLIQEANFKEGIKRGTEWGLPAETCKYDEALKDTIARCFFEELNTTLYSGLYLYRDGYYESDFIDEKGFARVVTMRCDRNVKEFVRRNDLQDSHNSALYEIQSFDWFSVDKALQLNLRPGMHDILTSALILRTLCTDDILFPLDEYLIDAKIDSLDQDIKLN